LFVVAVLFAALAIFFFVKYRSEYAAVGVWAALLTLISGAAGGWLLLTEGEPSENVDDSRVLVLLVGGLTGFATWVLSLCLAYQWRETILGGIDAWQGANWWHLWVFILAMFGGLALMFVSLLPARAAEHTNVGLRRLLYGYNAALTGLLLF